MTIYEAYIKAKEEGKKDGRIYLWGCKDYGDFWGFCFAPAPLGSGDGFGGLGDITVHKTNGKIGFFYPTINFDLFEKAKPVPLEQFVEKAAVA
jgi:hypothetical protein